MNQKEGGSKKKVKAEAKEKNLLDYKQARKLAIAETADDRTEFTFIGHEGPVYGVAISVCDKHILSASFDRTIRRWSMQTRGPLMVY